MTHIFYYSMDNEPKYSFEWVNGLWYNADGTQTYEGIIEWKADSTGWWVEDTSEWYPVSQWQRIAKTILIHF